MPRLGLVLLGLLPATSALGAETSAADIATYRGCPVAPPPLVLPDDADTSSLVADSAELADQVATARGNVHLERDGQTLEAPFVRYNRATTQTEARGGLKYLRDGLYLTADNGNVNTRAHTGEFENVDYSVLTNGARGKANQVSSAGNNSYQLNGADYSTCPGPTKAWLLSARRIDLDRASGRGVARDATLKIYDVPVFYTPYLNFPIDDQRHTGFLAPVIGGSGNSGFELATPYYINLADNYDATIVPRVMSKRGLQLGGQFRYLYEHHVGQLNGQILPYDAEYGEERDLLHYEHLGQLSENVGIAATFSRVSDDDYFDDLSNNLANTSTTNLERSVALEAVQPGMRFTLLAQDFQTLNDDFNGLGGRFEDNPYRRVPEARVEMLTPTAPFQVGLDGEFVNFRRDDSVNAYRTDARPKIQWTHDTGGYFLNSEAAYRITHYDLRDLNDARGFVTPTDDTVNRTIPSFEAGAGLRLSRSFNNGWIQTLTPRMQYLLVGYEDQSNIPIFDSGTATLNYDQLYSQNRFTGLDRVTDANQLTLGVSSRIISPNTGRTVGEAAVGRITSFRDQRVDLPNAGTTGYGDDGSDYVASGMFSPIEAFSARGVVQYNPEDSQIDRALASTTIGERDGYQLDLGYRYYRDYRPARNVFGDNRDTTTNLIPGQFETLSQIAVGARAPITRRVNLIGRWNYSLEGSQNVETLAGVEYRPSCCYAVRGAVRRFVADDNGNQDTAVMVQFVLRGLGQFGNSVASFVDSNVFSPTMQNDSYNSFDTISAP
ncbi:LPS-assembly protein LptD [uncultured Salinisphaera sp.]|uniref:LPS-assembly protein LptD n=1 Tax=uncultured Salinisphaera sp. TaxID=359372 RepID=UPI0032B16F93|tara:strand:+ start:3681 stop:6008 length:2328 start_codon:yes stop_codon:yes gene_type:complete